MMHLKRTLIALAVAAVLAPFAFVDSAGASQPAFDGYILGPAHIDPNDPDVAYVQARYICDDIDTAEWHLWVSVKQTEDGTADPALEAEGSSAVADTWLQAHPGDVTCDNRWHAQRFVLDTTEVDPFSGGTVGFGEAVRGTAWLQFCLIDFGSGDPFENGRFVIIQEWHTIQ